jgi:hypothetical protein
MKFLRKAIKETNEFVWYITYTDSVNDKLLTLYAPSAKKALNKAERKLRNMYGAWYKIKSISTV